MTDTDFLAWLKSPQAIRLALVEVTVRTSGFEVVRFLSTKAYTTSPLDLPANQQYDPIVSGGVQFTEEMSLSGEAGLSAGDIEVQNANGVRDNWLDDVWANRSIVVWIGDPRWARADFRVIFNGIVADIAPKGRDQLALKLRDKSQRLNTPVSEAKLGGTSTNKDALLPNALGEVNNMTPLLTNPATLEYQYHNGVSEGVIEAHDIGLPVSATIAAATGKFTLNQSPVGTVTASVQGDKTGGVYRNTVGALVQLLVTAYGKATERFMSADLDAANLAAFEAAHPQPVGLALLERTNVINACQDLAGSVGAQIAMSRLGQLRLLKIALPPTGTPTEIRAAQMVAGTLQPVSRTEVVAAVKLGFNKNWTVQQGAGGLPAEHLALLAAEWLTTTQTNVATQALYKLDAEPVQQNTLLLRRADAEPEALRRLNLYKTPRTVYQFEGMPDMLLLELGQAVKVFANRYGMQNGVLAQVISLSPDWLTCRVTVKFIL